MPEKIFRIAVYGSLRKGHFNHDILKTYGQYIADILLSGFELYNLGPYPAILPGEGTVVAEIYDVPPEVYWYLNRMEQGAGYRSATVDSEHGEVIVWVYGFPVSPSAKIESGDWNDNQDKN